MIDIRSPLISGDFHSMKFELQFPIKVLFLCHGLLGKSGYI